MAEIPGSINRDIESRTPTRPEFDGGAFTISAFSPSPEGFEIRTRNVLGRTEGLADNRALDTDARSRLKAAMQGEMKFNKVHAVKDARDAWKAAESTGADEDEVAQLEAKFYEERTKYQAKGKKLGIRNISRDGNVITADTKFVSFPVYNNFARPEDSPELIDLSANAAGAMIVRSKDGRLVIQHRAVSRQRLNEAKLSRGNAQFTDIPGASAAGMLDASLQGEDRQAGRPGPIDTGSVKGSILKEAGEELGLHDEDLEGVRIVGLAHDKIKIHDEFLLLADSTLTAEQIREKSRTSNKNKNLGDADFEEKFIDINGSADSIATLLTEVKCPLPPTHAAALVASGYSLVLQEQGKDAADAWKTQVEQGVQQNYREIDRRVKDFYDKHPEALAQVPERFWGKRAPARKLHGYDPAYAPEEQGLPSFEDAMVESGLMPETRRHVGEVLMFDVDGPISDPTEKQIKYDELVTQLSDRLAAGEPVFLNTGRSTKWVMERVTPRIKKRLNDPASLQNLVVIGEKGGTWVTFDENGEQQEGQIALSPKEESNLQVLNERVRELIVGDEEFKGAMALDPTKRTMVSVEMHDKFDKPPYDQFGPIQVRFTRVLQELTEQMDLGNYQVDPTTIATDIESKYVGKALGADRCLQWLRDNSIKAGRFVAFGDSVSDLEMADELQRRGQPVEFVYVGDPKKLEKAKSDGQIKDESIIKNIGGYSEGTLQYLSQQ